MSTSVPADHGLKVKECEKKNKYLHLARELKKETMEHEEDKYKILIVSFGTVTKGLLKGLENLEVRGRVVTI